MCPFSPLHLSDSIKTTLSTNHITIHFYLVTEYTGQQHRTHLCMRNSDYYFSVRFGELHDI